MVKGSRMTDEQRARVSVAHRGYVPSPEARAKTSASNLGHAVSVETRAKISVADKRHGISPETRVKMAVTLSNPSTEKSARMSLAHWKGGRQAWMRKHNAKRRFLGYVYLNAWFHGCEGHHVDNEQVIHMPKSLHRSIFHQQSDGRGMAQINAVAYNFLFKQEVETAMAMSKVLEEV